MKMRENIGLYRGKRKDNGEWIEGYYSVIIDDYSEEDDCAIFPLDNTRINGDGTVEDYCFVIPETVGQFTGLTDKNGKRIFEGDIVRYGDTIHRVVFEQRNGTAYFGLIYSPIETLPFGHYQDLKQREVIGNIYDNPELIKE